MAVQGRGFYSEEMVAMRGLGTSFTHNYMQYLNATGSESKECGESGSDGADGGVNGGGGEGDSGCGCGNASTKKHPHPPSQQDDLSDKPTSLSPPSSSHDSSLSWFAESSFIRALHRNTTGTRASLLVTLRLPAAAHLYIIPFPLYKVNNQHCYNITTVTSQQSSLR